MADKILSLEREIETCKEMEENLKRRLERTIHEAKTEYLYGRRRPKENDLYGAALQARYSACLVAMVITHPNWRGRLWQNIAEDLKRYDSDFFKEYFFIHNVEDITIHQLQCFLKNEEEAAHNHGIL